MSTSQTLNVDSLVLDPFVSKFHLIRDIGKSTLQTLFLGCTRAFGEDEIKHLLTSYCLEKLEHVSNINDNQKNEWTSILRASLIRHHEKFNPSNPALLHKLPATVLSKCLSYVDINTLLCSVELVSRDWFHVSRLASSISEFPANANIPFKLKRLTHATTLSYTNNHNSNNNNNNINININALKHINRLYVDGVLPTQLVTKCSDSFIAQLNKIEISYSSKPMDSIYWKQLTNKCNNLRVLRLKNIIISKISYQKLIKFISSLKNLNEFVCHRWRFIDANMTINNIIKALSEHCRLLKTLKIEYCRINDKAIVHITKLMEHKLNCLWIINCNRLKMATLNELGHRQEQLLLSSKYYQTKKKLSEFKIDDKMISCAIFDHFCGLKSLSIAADHLSGKSLSYSMLNKFDTLQHVTIQFRSSIDRLSSHSSSQFDWKLFFEELGKTLIYVECNCQVITNKSNKLKHKKIKNDISNFKLLTKEDYTNFMILDFNIFIYIATYCKKLKILKMSGWKFDAVKAKNDLDSISNTNSTFMSDEEIKENVIVNNNNNNKQIRKSGRSNSLHFLNRPNNKSKHNKIKTRYDFNNNRKYRNNELMRPLTHRYASINNNNNNNNHNNKPKTPSPQRVRDSYNDIPNENQSILTMENLIMIPISNLLQTQQSFMNNNSLDYMKLEWMFDFGDIPSLNTLNFWCDTVLGLNCTMSMNEELKAGSVLILEWNQNWINNYIQPTIIHHQSNYSSVDTQIISTNKYKNNTKQRLKKIRQQKQNNSTNNNANNSLNAINTINTINP